MQSALLTCLLVLGSIGGLAAPSRTSAATQSATPTPPQSGTWLTNRGNAARTGATSSAGPTTYPEQIWSFSTGNSIVDQPLVYGGLVLAAHGVGSLMALDLASGLEAWRANPGSNGPRSTTLSEDGIAVVKDRDNRLYAYDILTGEQIWTTDGMGYSDPGPIVDGVLYSAGDDGTLYAIDIHTGESLWSVLIPAGIDGNNPSIGASLSDEDGTLVGLTGSRPPAAAEGILAIANPEGQISAVDLIAHEVLWTAPCIWPDDTADVPARIGNTMVDTPTIADGIVYIACNWQIKNPGPGVYGMYELVAGGVMALDAKSGKELWRFQTPTRASLRTPAVGPNAVYAVGTDGVVYALAKETGAVAWQSHTGSEIVAPPALADSLLYVVGTDGSITAIDVADGNLTWQIGNGPPPESERRLARGPYVSDSGPVVVDGLLILANEDSVVVLGNP